MKKGGEASEEDRQDRKNLLAKQERKRLYRKGRKKKKSDEKKSRNALAPSLLGRPVRLQTCSWNDRKTTVNRKYTRETREEEQPIQYVTLTKRGRGTVKQGNMVVSKWLMNAI